MSYELFLAVVDNLVPTNPNLHSLFTSHENYLCRRSQNGISYLGKALSSPLSYEDLLEQKKHIASLLAQIFPGHSYSNDQFLCLIL